MDNRVGRYRPTGGSALRSFYNAYRSANSALNYAQRIYRAASGARDVINALVDG